MGEIARTIDAVESALTSLDAVVSGRKPASVDRIAAHVDFSIVARS